MLQSLSRGWTYVKLLKDGASRRLLWASDLRAVCGGGLG